MSSLYDLKENMAASHQAHDKEMETLSRVHRKRNNPIVKRAGLKPQKRKGFYKDNPEATALYNKTYQQMDDVELRKQFGSDDKKVVAAMAIATQRTARDNNITADNLEQLDSEMLANSNFKANFEEAMKDIDDGLINPDKPYNYLKLDTLDKLDAKKNKARLNKKAKANGKVMMVETVVGCKKKSCELTKFTIKAGPTSGSDAMADLLVKADKRAGDKVNEMLEKYITAEDDADGDFSIDLMESSEPIDNFHFTGGYLPAFARHFTLDVGGACGFGSDAYCPSIEVESKEAHIDKLKKHKHSFNKRHKNLSNLQLNPPAYTKNSSDDSVKKILKLLKPKLFNSAPAIYRFSLTSCSDSGMELYKGFNPVIYIHQKSIAKFSLSVKYDIKKGKLIPSVSFVGRYDDANYNISLDPEALAKRGKSYISDFCGRSSIIVKSLTKAGEVYEDFAKIGKTDELASESKGDGSDADWQNPQFNLSYLRKTVNLPKKDFSEIGFDQSIFLSASPLFKFQKEVDLLNLFWRKSRRLGIAILTSGFSEVALLAVKGLGIEENVNNTFDNFVVFMKSAVVPAAKELVSFKNTSTEDLEGEPQSISSGEATDEEVGDFLGDKKGRTIKCLLRLSAAVETDDPSAGMVFTKKAGEDEFLFNSGASSIYAGVNAEIEAEVSSDLQFLKSIGFGSILSDAAGGGIKAAVKSADKTGESRFGYTFAYFKKQELMVDQEHPVGKAEALTPKGLCYQRFYSGLSVYIEAFMWVSKSETGGKDVNEKKVETESSGRGEEGYNAKTIQDKEAESIAKAEKSKTILNFRVFKARESEFKPIKNIFSRKVEQ